MEVPWNLVVPEVDVYVVGYGNRLPNDFTLEMLAVLRRCKQVFAVPALDAPSFGLPEMKSLNLLYNPSTRRDKTYDVWVEMVLDAAATDAPVAFATYGSAMVGTNAAHRILELAPQRGLSTHVTTATSCFDGIWADFNIDPFRGVQIWEATGFLGLGIEPDPGAHLLLAQVPMLGVRGGFEPGQMRIKLSSTVAKLRDHLLRFYPSDHEVHFDTTSAGSGSHVQTPHVETLPLRDLDHPGRLQASTLLVPRLERSEHDFVRPRPYGHPSELLNRK
jgi:uncharacterized protein YabN with tetrapyrrole methylase and pyrophosphatase domain